MPLLLFDNSGVIEKFVRGKEAAGPRIKSGVTVATTDGRTLRNAAQRVKMQIEHKEAS